MRIPECLSHFKLLSSKVRASPRLDQVPILTLEALNTGWLPCGLMATQLDGQALSFLDGAVPEACRTQTPPRVLICPKVFQILPSLPTHYDISKKGPHASLLSLSRTWKTPPQQLEHFWQWEGP